MKKKKQLVTFWNTIRKKSKNFSFSESEFLTLRLQSHNVQKNLRIQSDVVFDFESNGGIFDSQAHRFVETNGDLNI